MCSINRTFNQNMYAIKDHEPLWLKELYDSDREAYNILLKLTVSFMISDHGELSGKRLEQERTWEAEKALVESGWMGEKHRFYESARYR